MKQLFLGLLLVFAVATGMTYLSEPDLQRKVPVIYITWDPSPDRIRQLNLFHRWLLRTGRVAPDGGPAVELRIDASTDSAYERMVQAVSGVAGDLVTGTIPFMWRSGMLEDITDIAREKGLSPDRTYEGAHPDFESDGRQYGFITMMYSVNLWVNVETFRRYGMEPPPRRWDIETFEQTGKEFVRRANPPGERQKVFFMNSVQNNNGDRFVRSMHRDLGLSDFNETLTRCTLDDERFALVLERIHRWTYEDHLMPTAADEASVHTEGSFDSSMLPLFARGTYAMIPAGRHFLIRLREFETRPELSLSFFPADEFTNAVSIARTAAIYRQSRHKDEAMLFLQFLTSPEYNNFIVEGADGLPPLPEYTRKEAFLRPPEHPNEWGLHEALLEAGTTLAIARPHSPFVPLNPTLHFKNMARDKVLENLASPRDAAREAAERINAEINRTIQESPRLRKLYHEWTALQDKIERTRAEGRKVPLEWIKDPFHRAHYLHKGWATEERTAISAALR